METCIFISYSRQQLYFAEALALSLAQRRVLIWFDIQQLGPSSSWTSEIQRGLAASSAMVLVASRASIASPYVRREWEAALQAHKPVYVVYFEAVDLPLELHDAPRFDLRTHFERGVAALAECMQGAPARPMPQLQRAPLELPTRLALPVLAPPLALACTGSATLLAALSLLPYGSAMDNTRLLIALMLSSLWLLVQATLFIRRRFDFRHMRWALVGGLACIGLIAFIDWRIAFAADGRVMDRFTTSFSTPIPVDMPLLPPLLYAVGGLMIGLLAYSLYAMHWSAAVLRWMPLGEAPERTRRHLHGRLVPQAPHSAQEQRGAFTLSYAPEDYGIAWHVENYMRARGHRRHSTIDTDVDYRIVVLSNKTRTEQVRPLLGAPNLLGIVATSIHIGDDLAALYSYQWVDFRRQSSDQLSALGDYMQDRDAHRTSYGLNVVPESLRKHVVPPAVTLFGTSMRIQAAMTLHVGIYAALLFIQRASDLGMFIASVLLIMSAVSVFWVVTTLLERRLTLYLGRWMTGLAGAAYFIALLPVQSSVLNHIIMSCTPFLVFRWLSHGRRLHGWLVSEWAGFGKSSYAGTMSVPHAWQSWLVNLLYAAVVLAMGTTVLPLPW